MNVSFCKTMEVNGEVTLSSSEIQQALEEDFKAASSPVAGKHHVLRWMNGLLQCLNAVTKEMIERCSVSTRMVIVNHLLVQAHRWGGPSVDRKSVVLAYDGNQEMAMYVDGALRGLSTAQLAESRVFFDLLVDQQLFTLQKLELDRIVDQWPKSLDELTGSSGNV